jgi:hypothetical protein
MLGRGRFHSAARAATVAMVAVAVPILFFGACRRGSTSTSTKSVESAGAPMSAESSSNGPSWDPNGPLAPRDLPSAGESPSVVHIPAGTLSAATTTEKPVDPFELAMADVRAGAVSCFAGLPAGEYAATLVMTASVTGRVTRSEVEAGNVTDEQALACLQTYAASRSFPASKDGRTVRVEVRVKGEPTAPSAP